MPGNPERSGMRRPRNPAHGVPVDRDLDRDDALKFGAYFLTDSGEPAFRRRRIAGQPCRRPDCPDGADHCFPPCGCRPRLRSRQGGVFFQRGEGALILVAAVSIIYAAVGRFLHPAALENLGPG